MTVLTRSNRLWPWAIVIGLIAGIISIGRLWLFDRSAPTQVLWAEDGLFTLCIPKSGFWTCLTDPFGGYLPFLQRVLVWPISLLHWEHWALAANLVAAAMTGIVCALVFLILRRFGAGWFVSIVIALLPVISPMSGLEVINTIGSSYMLLLFISTLFIALPPQDSEHRQSPVYVTLGAVLMLITALTIPSAVVLLPLLLIVLFRGFWSLWAAIIWFATLIAGLAVQFMFTVTAEVPRQLDVGADTLNSWADSIPISLLTYWPGLSIGEFAFFSNFSLAPLGITGWLMALGLLALSLWWITRGAQRQIVAGVLILAGLGFGLIPSAIGYANNRYFVVPVLLWGAALLIALDPRIRRARPLTVVAVSVIVAVIWLPAIPASAYRATPAPPWSDEVARVQARCAVEPEFVERPIFTPFWPPNWGDEMTEPTHPSLPCLVVWRWID